MERRLGAGLVRIVRGEYADRLGVDKHVFLVGDLQQPTDYPFIRDERVELVLVCYAPGDDGRFHWHERVTEYELVVEGEIGYLEVATGVTHWFAAGDLVAIPAGACVRRLVRQPARGVTLKVPSLATKIHCDACPRACRFREAPFAGSAAP
jgi:quercetin dioxygenase-like cupin family protein